MDKRKILITDNDARRLGEILAVAGEFKYQGRADLAALAGELRRAQIVDSRKVPGKVVTMNSRLVVEDLDNNQDWEFSLVFPASANADEGRISVLSPVGTALLGYSEGDRVEWAVPAGRRRLLVKKVAYQPEAAGDYHL